MHHRPARFGVDFRHGKFQQAIEEFDLRFLKQALTTKN